MARPTKLTPEVQARLVHAISVGASYKDASAYAGISYQTFLNWRKRALKIVERMEKLDDEPEEVADPFVEFFDRIKRAQGEAAVKWLTAINKAAHRDWKAAAWSLERRYPESYGRPRSGSGSGNDLAHRPMTGHVPTLDKGDADEILRVLSETGVLVAQSGTGDRVARNQAEFDETVLDERPAEENSNAFSGKDTTA